jgi:Sporulation and spore germination
MNKNISSGKKYIFSIIVAATVAGLSGCNSNPNTSGNNNTAPNNIASSPSPNSETATSTPAETSVPLSTPTPTSTSTPQAVASPTPTIAELRKKNIKQQAANVENKAISGKTSKITVFTSDAQCQELVPKEITVSGNEPVAGAVGEIIKERDTNDLKLSGYRVNVKNGVATVDLNIGPGSKRDISSLSSCENFALFQSMEKTLTSNPQWGIKDVKFTNKGKEIVF